MYSPRLPISPAHGPGMNWASGALRAGQSWPALLLWRGSMAVVRSLIHKSWNKPFTTCSGDLFGQIIQKPRKFLKPLGLKIGIDCCAVFQLAGIKPHRLDPHITASLDIGGRAVSTIMISFSGKICCGKKQYQVC